MHQFFPFLECKSFDSSCYSCLSFVLSHLECLVVFCYRVVKLLLLLAIGQFVCLPEIFVPNILTDFS